MNDPRWIAWRDATRRALDADDAHALEAIEAARAERAELMESLRADPARPPSSALAAELEASEQELQARIARIRAEITRHVEELRRVRSAAQGYRPVASSGPSLISKDV